MPDDHTDDDEPDGRDTGLEPDRPDDDRHDTHDGDSGRDRDTGPTPTRERQPVDADEVERSREQAEDLRRTSSPTGDQAGIVPARRQDST